MLDGGPGIVGAEVPNVPFGIAARIVPAPVVLVLDFNHDLRARRDSSCVVFVGVVDDDVRALRYGATQGARRLLKIVELARARGAEHYHSVPEDGTIVHAQLVFGNGMVMLGSARASELDNLQKPPSALGGAVSQSPYIIVDDADKHYARAVAAGAEIVMEIRDEDYGGRDYSCRDPEGHVWNFGSYDPWASA